MVLSDSQLMESLLSNTTPTPAYTRFHSHNTNCTRGGGMQAGAHMQHIGWQQTHTLNGRQAP